jgi:hypothetical protein
MVCCNTTCEVELFFQGVQYWLGCGGGCPSDQTETTIYLMHNFNEITQINIYGYGQVNTISEMLFLQGGDVVDMNVIGCICESANFPWIGISN